MCCCCRKKEGCQRPDQLKDKPTGCPPEQVEKCHGGEKEHPCVRDEKS